MMKLIQMLLRARNIYERHGLALILYYFQRLIFHKSSRGKIISILAFAIGRKKSSNVRIEDQAPKVFSLNRDGLVPLGALLTSAQCEEILAYLNEKRITEIHCDTETYTLNTRPKTMKFGAYDLKDIVRCPHILELANRPELVELATRYLGCTPTISILSVRWSFPGGDQHAVQKFHRDSEDWKYIRIMVYLTDVVDDDSGPHVYVIGTHQIQSTLRLKFYADDEIEQTFGRSSVLKQTGRRGSGFAVDTAGIHKGQAPRRSSRLLLSFQYSILPCFLYKYDPVEFTPGINIDPYVNRLILKQPI